MTKEELGTKIKNTFNDEQEHKDTLTFMLKSDVGTLIQMQSEETIHQLAILLKEYHVEKSK